MEVHTSRLWKSTIVVFVHKRCVSRSLTQLPTDVYPICTTIPVTKLECQWTIGPIFEDIRRQWYISPFVFWQDTLNIRLKTGAGAASHALYRATTSYPIGTPVSSNKPAKQTVSKNFGLSMRRPQWTFSLIELLSVIPDADPRGTIVSANSNQDSVEKPKDGGRTDGAFQISRRSFKLHGPHKFDNNHLYNRQWLNHKPPNLQTHSRR